jgi:hypothetical protein
LPEVLPVRVVAREDGATYRRMLDFVRSLEIPPHLIVVDSFNDYQGNTHIESSQGCGSLYLTLTRHFIAEARGRWVGWPNERRAAA